MKDSWLDADFKSMTRGQSLFSSFLGEWGRTFVPLASRKKKKKKSCNPTPTPVRGALKDLPVNSTSSLPQTSNNKKEGMDFFYLGS